MAKTNLGKVGITPEGTWNSNKGDYQYLDLVRYNHPDNGGAYIVRIKTGFVPVGTLPTNTTYFALVAKDGANGGGGGDITFQDVVDALGFTPASADDLVNKADLVGGKVPAEQLPTATAGLELGETNSTAYRGDRGKIAYDHSQATHAPSNAQKNSDITKAEIEAKLTGEISSHTHKGMSRYDAITNVAANKTIAIADENTYWTLSGTRTVTVPTNLSVAFPIGGRIDIQVAASGKATFSPSSGVTITSSTGIASPVIDGFKVVTLVKTGTNTWTLIG